MIIDLHVHTRHYSGCSSIEPEDIVGQAVKVGLDGVVFTEHGILWAEKRLAPLREEGAKHGLLILAGQEITCMYKGRRQDFLVFGINRSLGTSSSPRKLIQLVHDEGGIVLAAHPFKPSRLGVGYHGAGEDIYDLDLDGVEMQHPDHNEKAKQKVKAAAEKLRIPMTGGSDSHEIYQLGEFSTRFVNRVTNMEELVAEIRAGRVEPVNGMPRG
ncbi:MAG: PHP-associated domain-containing protein [Thermodesulfobacteriota bacterium]|nr:PHP-associated domain-containing protein [Thermodesulfobacteriota bacterium]